MIWDDEFSAEIESWDHAGLRRRPSVLASAAGRTCALDGRDVLMFGSNNYLGLAGDSRVRDAAMTATCQLGVGSSGSRLLSGNHALNEELEREIAAFKGAEAALVFASGYAANLGAIPALVGRGDLVVSDELNHASIIDGCRLSRAEVRVYPHGDARAAGELLSGERHKYRRAMVITDGVFSVDGDVAPLPGLCAVAESHDAVVYVDDAHGVGVLGHGGRGTASHLGVSGRPSLIEMGTLSKALGSLGGYVAGSRALIEVLTHQARSFVFSHGLPPGVLNSARCALRILRDEPDVVETLADRSARLRAGLGDAGLRVSPGDTPIVPVHVGDAGGATRLAGMCLDAGLYAPAIRPPTVPAGTSRVRLSVMATHTVADIHLAVKIISASAAKLGMIRTFAPGSP